MSARISVQRTGQPTLDLRLLWGGLAATLATGVVAGYLAATLPAKPSTIVNRAPASTMVAPSTGVYGDRDSRLPYLTSPAPVDLSGNQDAHPRRGPF